MRILDRYIARSILYIFTSTIFLFAVLYILINSASNLDDYIDRQVPVMILIRYYLSYFPIIFTQTAPMACLIAILLTYSSLNTNNELIALRTSGLNFWRIAKPAICFSLIISALIFLVNERFVPESESQSEKIRIENMVIEAETKRQTKQKIKNLTFYGLKNRLYFIDQFDPNTFEMIGITIISFDENQNIIEKTIAWKGAWTGIIWKFYQCQVSTFDPNDIQAPIKVKVYPEKLMDIKETPQDFLQQRLNVTSMNIKQLRSYISKFENSGAVKAINNLRVDLHQKYAYPFSNAVIILVGLPLVMLTGRRKAMTFTSIGIAIGIGFLYYVCNAVGLAFGKGGLMPPFYAAWLAPVLFFCLALYLVKINFE